jgi:hypothetical protein
LEGSRKYCVFIKKEAKKKRQGNRFNPFFPPTPFNDKSSIRTLLKHNGSIIEDLIKDIKELKIKLAKFEEKGQFLRQSTLLQNKECGG